METGESVPPKDFENQIKRAQENFRTISDLRQKLDILTEHVESRKGALEEEIEESLHEAIRNAGDSLERIQENIAPKLDKAIAAKLEDIDHRMDRWKKESLEAVRDEIQKESPALSRKVLNDLDGLLAKRLKALKEEMSGEIGKGVEDRIQSSLTEMKNTAGNLKKLCYLALGLSVLALLAVGGWIALH